jgi:hypothetical protein
VLNDSPEQAHLRLGLLILYFFILAQFHRFLLHFVLSVSLNYLASTLRMISWLIINLLLSVCLLGFEKALLPTLLSLTLKVTFFSSKKSRSLIGLLSESLKRYFELLESIKISQGPTSLFWLLCEEEIRLRGGI